MALRIASRHRGFEEECSTTQAQHRAGIKEPRCQLWGAEEMAEGRFCSSFSKVLLFGFVLIVAFASVMKVWTKDGHCFSPARCTFLFSSTCLCSCTPTKFASEGSVEEMVQDEVENPTTKDIDEVQNFGANEIHKFVDGKGIQAKDYFEDMYLKVEVEDPWADLEVVSVWEYFSASVLHSLDQEQYLSATLPQASETRELKLEIEMANPEVESHSQKAKEEHVEPFFPAQSLEHLESSFAECNSERLGQSLLLSIASTLPAIPDNGVEIPNEDPVSFTDSQAYHLLRVNLAKDLASPAGAANLFGLSSKGVMALLITILVIAFKHYKKVCRGSRNVAPMQRREETHVKASPSLTGMNIPRQEDVFNAMRHWERKRMQSYLSPWGIRSLPTPLLNNAESHLSTRKVQQISEYRGFLFEQLADYRGFRRSTIVLKLKQKNKDLWETRLKSGR